LFQNFTFIVIIYVWRKCISYSITISGYIIQRLMLNKIWWLSCTNIFFIMAMNWVTNWAIISCLLLTWVAWMCLHFARLCTAWFNSYWYWGCILCCCHIDLYMVLSGYLFSSRNGFCSWARLQQHCHYI
jgi:hypothetical protein